MTLLCLLVMGGCTSTATITSNVQLAPQPLSLSHARVAVLPFAGAPAGLIAFAPGGTADPKQITHADKDVLCYVLRGRGRLRVDGTLTPLEPGTLCHVPAEVAHDFAATDEELLLLYVLIETAASE